MRLLCERSIAIKKTFLQILKLFEKKQALYDNLEQKEGEGSTAGELNASKEGLDNFRKRFGWKSAMITREATDELPLTIKKITIEKEYLPEWVCNADKSAQS